VTVRYVAFLRGINVGKHNRIAMPRLKELMVDRGYADPTTYLQSGNVVFTGTGKAAQVATDLEDLIHSGFELPITVVVRTAAALATVVTKNPFAEHTDEPAKLLVAVLSAPPAAAKVRDLDPAAYEPDEFRVQGKEIYLWYPKGVRATKIGNDFWEKQLSPVRSTARNWTTVTKLLDLAQG
jgi:uncharacterized protein (DUF1697 family)